MTPQDLTRQIASRSLLPLYYLHGAEDFLIERMTQALAAAALEGGDASFNLHVVWASEHPERAGEAIVTAAEPYPVFAPRRVVIVRDAEKLPVSPRLLAYLRKPAPETVLIFAEAPPVKPARARARRKKADASVLSFLQSDENGCGRDVTVEFRALREAALSSWIASECADNGRGIDPDAAMLLVELAGTSLRGVATEIQKLLTAYPGEDAIRVEQVREQLALTRSGDIFELGKLVVQRRAAEAQDLAARLLDGGDAAVPMVAYLAKTIATLWQLRAMPELRAAASRAPGWGDRPPAWGDRPPVSDETARALGYIGAWQLKEIVACLPKFPDEAYFDRCFEHLLEADLTLKSRSTTDPRAVVAALIHRLASPQG